VSERDQHLCFLDEQEHGVVSDRSSPTANMSAIIAAFTIRGVETKKKPCPNGLMVVAGMTLAKASRRDGGGQRRGHMRAGEVGENRNPAQRQWGVGYEIRWANDGGSFHGGRFSSGRNTGKEPPPLSGLDTRMGGRMLRHTVEHLLHPASLL
jgi:hypothetical protein